MIKARFGSLKKIPIDIRGDSDHIRCSQWITSCVILHNMLIFLRDDFEFALLPAVDLADDVADAQASPQGKVFQDAVRDRWLRDVLKWV